MWKVLDAVFDKRIMLCLLHESQASMVLMTEADTKKPFSEDKEQLLFFYFMIQCQPKELCSR